jgi:hypothetical protein
MKLSILGDAALQFAVLYLRHYGYLLPGDDVWSALHRFRERHGLNQAVGQNLDDATLAYLMTPRCGVPDHLEDGTAPEFLTRDMTYYVASYVPGLAKSVQDGAFESAWKGWSEVADVRMARTLNQSQAHLVIHSTRLDGPGRVLGQCHVGPWAGRQLRMDLDSGDTWVSDPRVQEGIGFEEVVAHEGGHWFGLGHSKGLMAPTYKPGLKRPQPVDDIPRIQAVWGKPTTIPPPAPPTPPPAIPRLFVLEVYEDGSTRKVG